MVHRSRRPRAGFTLIELVVTIAIVGLLVALLLPAVQSSRASARAAQCRSHLHQIGIAAQQYESAHRVFPGSALLGEGQWQRQMLPYLEQPEDVEAYRCPIYECPADRFADPGISYQVNDGLWAKDTNGYARAAGARYVRPADITDGLSNTAAFSEKLAHYPGADAEGPPGINRHLWIRRIRGTSTFIPAMDAFADECRDNPLPPPNGLHILWAYNHVTTPNQNSCYNGPRTQPEHQSYLAVSATSEHAGGVHLLYADGHVGFSTDHVDRFVWRALGTRQGGETVVP